MAHIIYNIGTYGDLDGFTVTVEFGSSSKVYATGVFKGEQYSFHLNPEIINIVPMEDVVWFRKVCYENFMRYIYEEIYVYGKL